MGVLSYAISSYKKTKKLHKISKIIGKERSTHDIYIAMRDKDDSYTIIRKEAKEELFDICETFPALKDVMDHYGATREHLRILFDRYEALGFGQWVRGDYTLVSSFAFPRTLDYLLANYDKSEYNDKLRIKSRLHIYFAKGEVGAIHPDE